MSNKKKTVTSINRKKRLEKKASVRIQGIEPWSVPWEGTMIPLHQMRFVLLSDNKTLI